MNKDQVNKVDKAHIPIVIGVNGGTASGKTTFAEKIRDMLLSTGHKTVMISQDSFYKNLNKEQLLAVEQNNYNFDHPDAIDFNAMKRVLKELVFKGTIQNVEKKEIEKKEKTSDKTLSKASEPSDDSSEKSEEPSEKSEESAENYVEVPIYDFVTHQRSKEVNKVVPGDSIIIEGLFIFNDPELRSLMNIKLFVDVDDDTRLARRIRRDIMSRGRDVNQILESYEKYVKPGYRFFIEPYKRYSDIIVPYGGHNEVAVLMISQYLRRVEINSDPNDSIILSRSK